MRFIVDRRPSHNYKGNQETGDDEMTKTFEAGKTYATRSICDSECVISLTVASRTAKTIKTTAGKVLRISEYAGEEYVKPWGSYSMAPAISAGKVA
jgi:hypothetical protein